jgi:hypothetical protein
VTARPSSSPGSARSDEGISRRRLIVGVERVVGSLAHGPTVAGRQSGSLARLPTARTRARTPADPTPHGLAVRATVERASNASARPSSAPRTRRRDRRARLERVGATVERASNSLPGPQPSAAEAVDPPPNRKLSAPRAGPTARRQLPRLGTPTAILRLAGALDDLSEGAIE